MEDGWWGENHQQGRERESHLSRAIVERSRNSCFACALDYLLPAMVRLVGDSLSV